MRYCIAVFKSRTAVMEFAEALRENNVGATVINTPPEAHVGCGVCVRFPYVYSPYAYELIQRYSFGGFKGFFLVERVGARTTVRRL